MLPVCVCVCYITFTACAMNSGVVVCNCDPQAYDILGITSRSMFH